MTSPSLSVVLPCRNQADHIGRVLLRYFAPLDTLGCDYELIVVPNASRDGTADAVRDVARRDGRVRVVENPRGGWGLSVLTGLQAAHGQVLCYTNSARTDPESLPALWDLYRRHAPCLAKARRVERNAPLRELGSLLFNLEGKLLFRLSGGDVNGTPKLFSRELFEQAALESEGDLLDMELLAQASRRRVQVVELPIAGFQRHGGKSSTTLTSAWRMYLGAWLLRRRLNEREMRRSRHQ
jgi:glycosyltransferase involved in cell wall biosynthesis